MILVGERMSSVTLLYVTFFSFFVFSTWGSILSSKILSISFTLFLIG